MNDLVRMLQKTDDELREDQVWVQGRRKVRAVNLSALAEERARSSQHRETASAPDESPLSSCLMMDGRVRTAGMDDLDINLSVGDTIPVVYEHLGRLTRGESSIRSVRSMQPRDRDLVSLRAMADSIHVCVTSNHSIMARRPGHDIVWGPVVARDLTTRYQVVVDRPSTQTHDPETIPLPIEVTDVTSETRNATVVEVELSCGHAAFWLQASGRAYVASFGELPYIPDSSQRKVAMWGFSRCPKEFTKALRVSPVLDSCRSALEEAGFPFHLPSGGHMFVRTEDAQLVLEVLRRRGTEPRPKEVVVAPEYETRLEEALCLVPPRHNVHRLRPSKSIPLDSTMRSDPRYRRGQPFQYVVAGRVVQGKRTFISLDESTPERQFGYAATV